MSEKEKKAPSVGGAAFGLADAVLKNKMASNRLAWAVGVIVILAACPLTCLGALVVFAVARTSAWSVWLTLGIIVGVSGTLLTQRLLQRREEVAQ